MKIPSSVVDDNHDTPLWCTFRLLRVTLLGFRKACRRNVFGMEALPKENFLCVIPVKRARRKKFSLGLNARAVIRLIGALISPVQIVVSRRPGQQQ